MPLRFDDWGESAPSNEQIGRALIEIAKAVLRQEHGKDVHNLSQLEAIADGDFDELDQLLKD